MKYHSVLRAMRDVYRDFGFTNPSANQLVNGAKSLLSFGTKPLDPEGGVQLYRISISAKSAGMGLMTREMFEKLEFTCQLD